MRAGEFIEFNPKISLKKNEIAPKISMEDLAPFTKNIESYSYAPYRGGAKFLNGDTLFARITPCLENGKTAYVDCLNEEEVGFGSTEFIVLRAIRHISDPNFVYYLSISPQFRSLAIKSMVGSSGRQRVQLDALANYLFRLPPLSVQKRIAGYLSSLDKKIFLNKRINDNLQLLAQTIYQAMFIDEAQSKVYQATLKDLAEITMGQSPNGKSYNTEGKGTVFYQGRADFGKRFPAPRLFTTEPKRIAEKGDILLSVRAPVGDLNIAYESCCIGRGLGAIRSKTEHHSFLFYTMLSLRSQFEVYNSEGTVFGSINKKELCDISINIPSTRDLENFECIVRPIDNLIYLNFEENRRLQHLRDNLLKRLLNGNCS